MAGRGLWQVEDDRMPLSGAGIRSGYTPTRLATAGFRRGPELPASTALLRLDKDLRDRA